MTADELETVEMSEEDALRVRLAVATLQRAEAELRAAHAELELVKGSVAARYAGAGEVLEIDAARRKVLRRKAGAS